MPDPVSDTAVHSAAPRSIAQTTGLNVYGISHVLLPVTDVGRSVTLYRDLLGFAELSSAPGFADLDAGGTVILRLAETPRVEHRSGLRIHTQTVEALERALLDLGCRSRETSRRTPARELEASVLDPDGHVIHLWRPLTEDEYDEIPSLPTALTWRPEADALLKSLLLSVPALFRALARFKVVRVAEELAESRRLVTREEVIRAFILASPRVTRSRNRQPLIDHGIQVDLSESDWNAE